MELGRILDKEEGSDEDIERQSVNAMGRRLTPSEVEEYKKQGKCFSCGKFGHLSRNCSLKVKPQAQQQQQQQQQYSKK